MKKILVPTDFSKTAQTAVSVAADVARKAGAELILLHVVEEASGNSFNVEGEATYGGNSEEKFFTLKLIERAKGILMKERSVNESEAYGLLRTAAMNENRRLIDVARSVVSAAGLMK
jgi:nucleotide-binding universal stress UspA family protein